MPAEKRPGTSPHLHTDPDLLGLLALGEQAGSDAERAHVHACPDCAKELSELRRLAELGRSIGPETAMATPSHAVWERIRAELDLPSHLEPPTRLSVFLPSDDLTPPQPEPEPVRPRRWTALLRTVRAAAEGALGHAKRSRPQVLADVTLAPVTDGWPSSSGSARLYLNEEGHRVLTLTLRANLPGHGLQQAWLVNRRDPNKLISLGVLDEGYGLWTVARSIDLGDFNLVDISHQDVGQLEHSGNSIVRGTLVP